MDEEGSSDAPPPSGSDVTKSLDAPATADVPEDCSVPKPSSGSDFTESLSALTAVVHQRSSKPPLHSTCDVTERPDAAVPEDVPEGSAKPPLCTTGGATENLDASGTAKVPESEPQWPRRIAGRVHKEGTIGHTQGFSGESDEEEREIRIDDLDVPRVPREVAKERLEQQQQQPPPHASALEPIYQTMRQVVSHFTKLHVDRECQGSQLVCVLCREAESTLLSIQEVVRKDPSMRAFVLGNTTFMGVLVKLCRLDSPVPPNICGVLGPDIKRFVEERGYCDGGSVSTLVKGHPSDKLWERFLGDAAKKVKRVTYSVAVRPTTAGGSDACAVLAASGEPVVAPADVQEGSFHSSLDVSGCLDARHLWVFNGANAQANVDGRLLAEVHRSLQQGPRENAPSVGEVAGLWTSEEQLERVLVVEVAEEVAVVWGMDRGNFLRVRWTKLVYLLTDFKVQPPAVCLAVLQDVKPVPFLGLLRECVNTLQVLTRHNTYEADFHAFMVSTMMSHGAIEVLVAHLTCQDYQTRMTSIVCLTQMCRRLNGRQAVFKAGGVKKVFDRLRKSVSDPPENDPPLPERERQKLLILLQTLFFRNWLQIYEMADTDMVGVLYKILESSPRDSPTSCLAQLCLRSVLDSGYKERRPSAQRKLVAMTPEKLGAMTGEKWENQASPADTSAPVQQHGVSAVVPSQAPPSEGDAAQQPSSVPGGGPPAAPSTGRFYLRGALLPLRCTDTRELRAVNNMKAASARSLARVTCSFLNMWKPCTVFYGISPDGHVRGVPLSLEERDALRRGIDFMVGNLRPHPTSTSVRVEFVPALWSKLESRKEVFWYVVEVHVHGVPRTVYTLSDGDCFLRKDGETYQAHTFEIRSWVVQQEEEYYLRGLASQESEGAEGGDGPPPGAPSADV